MTQKTNNGTVNKRIIRFQKEHLIKGKLSEIIISQKPRTPRFYAKTKIYKTVIRGRPVISSFNYHISTISKYVDYYLQLISGTQVNFFVN